MAENLQDKRRKADSVLHPRYQWHGHSHEQDMEDGGGGPEMGGEERLQGS